jgi:FdhD protein
MNPAIHAVHVVRVGPTSGTALADVAAAEEPLEIRLGGQPFVVIMRTPGSDRELAAGFLLSEQIVRAPGEIASLRYCAVEDRAGATIGPTTATASTLAEAGHHEMSNVLNVWLSGEAAARAGAAVAGKRHVTASSSCGVCGRRSIDDLMASVRPVNGSLVVRRSVVSSLPDTLRAAQRTFDETGGLHAAGLFDRDGRLLSVAEDIGRHNAVDKVLGRELLADRLPLAGRVLFVSGRTSFEIVQKAVMAGVPIVASVSAPSSLAVGLAASANLTLVGFVRGGTFNIYTGQERIER